MVRRTTRKFCMSALRKNLGFNANLIKVHYEKNRIGLEFSNKASSLQFTTVDYFEMYANGCDLNFFEEFADSCIDGFNGISLSDQEVIAKSKRVYRRLVRWFKEKESFERFLQQSQNSMEKVVQKIKNLSFIKDGQFESNSLRAYGQLPLETKGFGGVYKARMLIPVGSAHHY